MTEAERPLPTLPPDAPRARLRAPSANVACDTSRPVTLIGGRRNCDLPLNIADVSKVHAAVINTGEAIVICDLRSRSGTFVNGKLIQTAQLTPGADLRIGPVPVTVEFEQAAAGMPSTAGASAPLIVQSGNRAIEITGLAAVIGRRDNCEVVLDNPDVSLAHALLFKVGGVPCVYDLGSRSGTMLNGRRVTLAWLVDEDVLEIGGEKLVIRWLGVTVQSGQKSGPAGARLASAAVGNLPRMDALLAAATELGLPDLEPTIAALYTAIGAARSRLDQRGGEIDQREAALAKREQQLQARHDALEDLDADVRRRETDLGARQRSLEEKLCALDERERAVHAQELALVEQENALRRQRGEVEKLASHASAQQERVQVAQRELESRAAAVRAREAQLAEREPALAARQAQLDALAQQLALKEKRIADRQVGEADMLRKLAQFKTALQDATQTLAGGLPAPAVPNAVIPARPASGAAALKPGRERAGSC